MITLWLIWVLSTYCIYKRQAVCIHKIIFYMITLKCAVDLAYLMRILSCKEFSEPVFLSLMKTACSTIYHSFTGALICVLASGLTITNETFSRKQLIQILIITLAGYLGYSTYFIFGNSSETIRYCARVIIIAFSGYMIFTISRLCIDNIIELYKESRRILNERELLGIRKNLIRKIFMYIAFFLICNAFYIGVISENLISMIFKITDRQKYMMEGYAAIAGWILYLTILVLFHPCYFTVNFRLAQIIPREVFL